MVICPLVLCDGYEGLRLADGGEGGFHSEHPVLAQGRLDGLRVGALGQQELSVVLPVHGLAFRLFFVLCVDLHNTEVR